MTSPFHEGERAVQERLGVREQIEPWARQAVRNHLPDQHQAFYAELPFLVAAARDAGGRPWATLLAGADGFVRIPHAAAMEIDAKPPPGDALAGQLRPGTDLGLLGIEFATRRRNRVNGHITAAGAGVLEVAVDQSFGNCPQHIRERDWARVAADAEPTALRGSRLNAAQRQWISAADTFFIASGHRGDGAAPHYGMDASHRGGEPGFVAVRDAHTLIWPDYAGNNHNNTIGNLSVDPRVGMLFVDFENGHLLQITGRAEIDWESSAVAAVPGARRLVTIHIDALVELRAALPIRWRGAGDSIRSLRVTEKTVESADVTSFWLEPRDGGSLPGFEPGQHLPIEVADPATGQRISRTYSLSAAPSETSYRLSIKREPGGMVSNYLHDCLEPGDVLSARAPAGEFVLRPGARPVVLVSAGVGVTPMTSMLGALTAEPAGREIWFVHGARDGAHHALADEARRAGANDHVHLHVAYSRPGPGDVLGRHYDSVGRVDGELLQSLLPSVDADYYLCGPTAFMADVRASMIALGVADTQIHSESFGAS